jgi:hypothetical protein
MVYLNRRMTAGGKRRYVQIRRLLYLNVFGYVPLGRKITPKTQSSSSRTVVVMCTN